MGFNKEKSFQEYIKCKNNQIEQIEKYNEVSVSLIKNISDLSSSDNHFESKIYFKESSDIGIIIIPELKEKILTTEIKTSEHEFFYNEKNKVLKIKYNFNDDDSLTPYLIEIEF